MTDEFTKIVKYYLQQRNISVEDFAISLNLHTKKAHNMLKGDYNFKLTQIVRIEIFLDVKILKIAGRD
jgi:hypothetical protein